MIHPEKTIPTQQEGVEVNVEDSRTLSTTEEAMEFFTVVKHRLLAINRWKEWAGALSAGFVLTNEQGQEIDTFPRPGNYLKINIPAPGIATGEGFDWVRIEEVKEIEQEDCGFVTLRVRPASSPLNTKKDVAHFLTDEATSNFIVRRDGLRVTAGVYGRNEKPNTEADGLLDKLRNAVVGTTAVNGFAQLQWKNLVDGLLKH